MIILSTSTETLNVETRTEATVDVVVTYVDHTPTSYLANGTQTTITTAANTVIVPAAAAGTQRIVKFLSLCNRGIMIAQVSLIHTINGTPYLLTALVTLRPGESMIYHDDHWVMYDWNGRPREPSEMHMNLDAVVRHPLASQVVVNTGTRLLPSGTTVATYMGRAPRQATRIGVRYRITTASAALTWGEIAIATGVPSLGNNATLTVVGYNGANNPLILSSPGGTAISNGVFTSLVTLAPNYTIQQGEDVWVLFGNAGTTGATFRSSTIADDLLSGVTQTAVTRPSLNVGTAIAYTIDAVANLPLQVAMTYY